MKKCVYCTLPEVKDREIVGNNLAWVFPTNIPIVPGHVLIVPRRCVANMEDMTTDEREAIEALRVKMVYALKKTFGATGFNFAWNNGSTAGQAVPHFHLHVLPRKEGDTGIYQYDPRKFLYRPGDRVVSPGQELIEIVELIKQAL